MNRITLDEAIRRGDISLGRGNIISSKDIMATPGGYPIYSSSAKGVGEFGRYGHFMFNEELVTWSVDGGGRFFFRPKHKFSVTNVCGFMRVDKSKWDMQFVYYSLDLQHRQLSFDYQAKAHPSVIRLLYQLSEKPRPEQFKIAEILSTVDRAIEQTEALIAKQQRIKTGLMQDLLTRGIDEHGNLRSEETHQFKNSSVGRIPVEWNITTLNKCVPTSAPICYGILMPGRGHDGGVPVIKVKDIIGGQIIQDDILLTAPKIDEQYRRSRLQAGDVLLTIRGTTGRVAIVPPELDAANITQDTARVSLNEGLSNQFFYFLLQSFRLQDQIQLHTLGQAVKGINIGEVKRLFFGLPRKREQEEIACRLAAIQQAIDKSEVELLKQRSLKTGLMQDLLTGKVRVTPLLTRQRRAVTV